MNDNAKQHVPRDSRTLDERMWFEMFLLRLHTLDAAAFSSWAPVGIADSDPADVFDGFLLYSPRKVCYIIDRRQIIDMVHQRIQPRSEDFQDRLNQLVEITSVSSVRSRMYYEALPRIHLWNLTEAIADEHVPLRAKERLSRNEKIRTLHHTFVTNRMRGFSTPMARQFELDTQITMLLAQEACVSKMSDEHVLSLITH